MIATWLLMAASFLAGMAFASAAVRRQLVDQKLDIEAALARHPRSR